MMKYDGNKIIECELCSKKVKLKYSGNVAGMQVCGGCYRKELKKFKNKK